MSEAKIPKDSLQSLNRQFGEILLKASVQLSSKETSDNSYFIGQALGILERRVRSGRPSLTVLLDYAAVSRITSDAICNLSEPIIEQLETGSPTWGPSLARLLAHEGLSPLHAEEIGEGITPSGEFHAGFPKTSFLDHDTVNPLSVDGDYVPKWVAICYSMDKQSLLTDWEAKKRIVQLFSHLLMWHYDFADKPVFPKEGGFVEWVNSFDSPLSRLPGTLDLVVSFLDKNSGFLEPSTRNMWLLTTTPGSSVRSSKSGWKGSPSTLQKWDRILLKDSDLANLGKHFNDWDLTFTATSLLSPSETERIPIKSLTAGLFFVTSVESLTQSISLVSYTELQTQRPEKPTESISLVEIREWVELTIQEEDGYITLNELGRRWRGDKGISFAVALAPHDMRLGSLLQQIVNEREDLFWHRMALASGGRVRVLKEGETRASLEKLTAAQMQDKFGPDWISRWHIPKHPKHLWENLKEMSNELISTSSRKWQVSFAQRARPDRADHRFISLIHTQAMNTEEWNRKHGDPSDISPHGLLENMISAILHQASKEPQLDHDFVENHLNELRDSVLAHCSTSHVPFMSWRDEEIAVDTASQLDLKEMDKPTKIRARDLQMEKRLAAARVKREGEKFRKRMLSQFGPIVNSPNLISDYLRALSAVPESEDEFLKYAKKAYSERIKSSRTRYVGVGKSDRYVWKFWGLGRDLGLSPGSPEEVIKLFLLNTGLLEDKVKSLLEQSRKVQYPYAEKE